MQINGACGMLQLVFTSAKKSVIALQCLVRPRWTLRLALAHTLVKWQKPNWRFPPGPRGRLTTDRDDDEDTRHVTD